MEEMASRLPSLLHPPFGFATPSAVAAGDPADQTVAAWAREAVARDASGVSSPVWATADGVAVVATTGKVGGRFRRRSIAEVAFGDLSPEVAPLVELADQLPDEVALALEPRTEAAIEAVVALGRDRGPDLERRLWIRHADLAVLTSWRSRTEARLVHVSRLKDLDGGLERWTAELEARAIDGLCLPHGDWSGGRVALLHRFNRLALARGITFQREAAKVLDIGIDGLSSDQVDDMMAVIREFHGGPTGLG
jgi:hypothetical protein